MIDAAYSATVSSDSTAQGIVSFRHQPLIFQ
jgi:hypothetical protein